jgi:hypothetical protein
LGFPKIEAICKEQNLIIKENDDISTTLNITGLTSFTENEFLNWKNNIALIESEGVALNHTLTFNKSKQNNRKTT